MGWSSGSRTFSEIIKAVKPNVADNWDTQDECLDEDEAYDELLR